MLKVGIGLVIAGFYFLAVFIFTLPFIPNCFHCYVSLEEKLKMPYSGSYGIYLIVGLVMIGAGAILVVDNYKWKYMKTR
jgi:hypothetical protein